MTCLVTQQPAIVAAVVTSFVTLIVLVATIIANSRLAKRKFLFDCAFERWKAESQFCQEMLVDFYEAAGRLQRVRSPISWSTEIEARAGRETEDSKTRDRRDTFDPVRQRLDLAQKEVFNPLLSKRHRANALIGTETATAFDRLRDILVDVGVSIDMLLLEEEDASGSSAERAERRGQLANHRKTVWAHPNDAIGERCKDMLREVDRVFGERIRQVPKP